MLKIINSLILLSLLGAFFFSAPALVLAQDAPSIFDKFLGGLQPAVDEAYGGGQSVPLRGDPFVFGVLVVLNYLLTFAGLVFFLLLIYAGYLWMSARGNEEQVEKAKKMIREIIIGIIIILLARLITEFILFQIGAAVKN